MSIEDEDKLPDSSAGEGDSTASNTPVDGKADEVSREPSETGSPEAQKSTKSENREKLIKELSQPEAVDDEEDEEDEPEVGETEEVPEAKKPEEKAGEREEPESSEHDTSDRRSKAQQKFEKLTTHNRELKKKLDEATPFAAYGQSMFNYCKDAGLSTEKLGLWLSVAADAEKNPGGAKQNLERLGIKLDPVREVVKEIPVELEDALLDMTTNGQVAPEAFKALVGMIRKARASTPPPAPEPAPVQRQSAPAPTAAPQATDPRKAVYDQDLARAVADIDERETQLAAKYPADWPKLKAQIAESFKRYRGTDPKMWKGFFEEELNKVIAKAKRPVVPPASKAPIRPSTTSSAQKPPTTGRAALIAEITGKSR
jgi:hypothetical protein